MRTALSEAEANLYRELRSHSMNIDPLREKLSQAETAWLFHSYTCASCLNNKVREFFAGRDYGGRKQSLPEM
jgi:hypothetical protein